MARREYDPLYVLATHSILLSDYGRLDSDEQIVVAIAARDSPKSIATAGHLQSIAL
jgi:hypothetical protein